MNNILGASRSILISLLLMTGCNSQAQPTITSTDIFKPMTTPLPIATPTFWYLPTFTAIPPLSIITSTPISTVTTETTSTAIWDVPFGSKVLDDYIGREMPPFPYPSIYPLMGGRLLDDKPYGITFYLTKDESSGLILFSQLLYIDSKSTGHWLVLDAVVLNEILTNENFYTYYCSMNGVFRTDLIALGKVSPNLNDTKLIINRVWQADTVKKRLKELNPKSIECIRRF